METLTTIRQIFQGNKIFVPAYQRAYSWDTENEKSKSPTQTNVFLSDLEEFNKSETKSRYYFGHFLFEKISNNKFGVIDGQQRLTTIVIFLSALFSRLKSIRQLNEAEEEIFEDIIRRNSNYRFDTVDYDKQLLRDFVIDQSKKDKNGLDTESAKRIVNAFVFFASQLANKDEMYLTKMLETISNASCTTHPITDESEAIQMFIFQNNRGKKPSNLEIIKAQFMFNVHLYGGEEKEALIDELKGRFERIYKAISSIEYNIDEDDVLTYTLRVYFNSLWETNAIDRINKKLSEDDRIGFIREFTNSLANSFNYLTIFFGKDEREHMEIHSLVTLSGISVAIPFIIKAYTFGLQSNQINQLCAMLESLILRDRLIGTRADVTSRLNGKYQEFTVENPDIQPIIDHIQWMKKVTSDYGWWAYWNNQELERSIQSWIQHSTAKYLLWKYENYLELQGKRGYTFTRFDQITYPELEHIAPQTATDGRPVEAGYSEYDEEFKNQFLDCLGNYLLISKSHNGSVGNKPFIEKRNSYNHLEQQREIQRMTQDNPIWTKELIQKRKEAIIKFILKTF